MSASDYRIAKAKLTMDWRKSLLDDCNLLYAKTVGAAPSGEAIREAQYNFDVAKLDFEFASSPSHGNGKVGIGSDGVR